MLPSGRLNQATDNPREADDVVLCSLAGNPCWSAPLNLLAAIIPFAPPAADEQNMGTVTSVAMTPGWVVKKSNSPSKNVAHERRHIGVLQSGTMADGILNGDVAFATLSKVRPVA
jgi:hypothetical protein